MEERPEYAFKCPKCGLRPYGDQIKFKYSRIFPQFKEWETVTKVECSECGSKDLIPVVVDSEEYAEACSKANLEEPYVDMFEVASEERRNEIYKEASQEKLERLSELMRRYNRILSLMILEYLDGNANRTDESDYTIMWEIYKLLCQAQKDGKLPVGPEDKEDIIIHDSIAYSLEDEENAIAKVMKDENKKKS